MEKIKFEWHSVNDLQPYEHNARKHDTEDVEAIKRSIEQFGFNDPIGIWSDENLIVEGHGRLLAAKELGMEEVPCIRLDHLSDEERRAYALAHNKTAELSAWDFNTLDLELAGIEEIDMSQFGFDSPVEELEAVEDDYEPEIPEEPRTKVGDLYQLGRHRLICGDATDVDTMTRLFRGGKADISFTSPPYNAGHMDVAFSDERGGGIQKGTQKKYLNDDDEKTEEEYLDFLYSNLDILLMFSDEVFYNIGVGAGSKTAIAELLKHYKEQFKDLMYWEKENPIPVIVESVISSAVELIICLGKNGTRSFNHFKDRLFHGVIKGMSASTSNKYADVHKATFPVYLPSEIITRFTEEGGSVLDCFGGTGTTLIACEQLNRVCYMSELEPTYCDIIIDRWETLTGEKAILINDKENMD